jgi:hypothetical protein
MQARDNFSAEIVSGNALVTLVNLQILEAFRVLQRIFRKIQQDLAGVPPRETAFQIRLGFILELQLVPPLLAKL